MAKTNIVDWKTITSFVIDAFVGYGIPRKDAEICADILLESDKRGIESHGVNRFKPIYQDRNKAGNQNQQRQQVNHVTQVLHSQNKNKATQSPNSRHMHTDFPANRHDHKAGEHDYHNQVKLSHDI